MKIRIIAAILLCAVLLSGCAQNEMCTIDSVTAFLSETDTATAIIYADNQTYTFEITDEFVRLLSSGQWTGATRKTGETKILSVILDMQYEICLFENGYAMIYNGYTNLIEKDRAYYQTEVSSDAVMAYINAHIIENLDTANTTAINY